MDYFKILNLDREPFSNSPDPDFFFKSHQHFGCLQNLELSIRLRRGMNVVIGEVGTGKTTLCRQLLRTFADDDGFECHLILDPAFDNTTEFLSAIAGMVSGEEFPEGVDDRRIKESIKKAIYRKGIDQNKNLVLIIDEGQKLPDFCLEILRELLNYETNEHKLLQITIFAQLEFQNILNQHANFADRINLLYPLNPMSFQDTREMIRFRLRQSSAVAKPVSLFTYPAIWAIYRATKGYPRKIINLCHQSMLAMIIQNRTRAGWRLVQSCIHRAISSAGSRSQRYAKPILFITIVLLVLAGVIPIRFSRIDREPEPLIALAPLPEYHLEAQQILIPDKLVGEPSILEKAAENPSATNANPGALSSPSLPEVEPIVLTKKSEPSPVESGGAKPSKDPGVHPAQTVAKPPSVLGEVTLESKDTLGALIRLVYGTYQRAYLDAVLGANPHIQNPNKVQLGESVLFPVLPYQLPASTVRRWWVQIDKSGTLGEALAEMKSNEKELPPTLCIPSWSAETGLQFTIILRDHYFSKEKAERRLEKMIPITGREGARLIAGWDKNKTYFADPFRGQGY